MITRKEGGRMQNSIRVCREKLKQKKNKPSSQEAVATHAGMTRAVFGLVEAGRAIPTVPELEKIAEYLETTPGHLYEPEQIGIIFGQAPKQ